MTRRAARKKEVQTLQLVSANHDAMTNGPRRKTFSVQDMHHIEPLTDNQERAFELFDDSTDKGILLEGVAGCGKTFIAIYNALKLILSKRTPFKKLVICRSTIQTREQGFLKGDISEKEEIFKLPYKAIFDQIFKFKKSFENMEEAGIVEFCSTSFLRGRTIGGDGDGVILIYDEFQGGTYHESVSVLQRLGSDSKIVICGDFYQSDLKKTSEREEVVDFLELLHEMKSIDRVEFGVEDICRSGFVKDLILTQIKLGHM